jgi:hypothetical protein
LQKMPVHALGRHDAGKSPRADETSQVNGGHTTGCDLVEDRIAPHLVFRSLWGCWEAHGVCE